MNHYGTMAQRHWARWLPDRYAAIQDPDSFFSTLGEEVARQIADLMLDLAGDDPPGEDYLVKVGRLNTARHQAEEIVLREQVLLPPEPGAEEDPAEPEEPTPAQQGWRPLTWAQPPAVGAGERRADGTGPGQLARGTRFRPQSQDDLAPSGAVARVRANLAALSALRAIQRDGRPGDPSGAGGAGPLVGMGCGPRGLRPRHGRSSPGRVKNWPAH